jgi:pimeloyl-ACP methyl ester carboxylesterase
MHAFITPLRAIAALCLLLIGSPASAAPALLAVEGGQVSWEQCGEGRSKSVVLLHDGVLGAAAFDEIWPSLCKRYHVVRFDRRGYGPSPRANEPYEAIPDIAAVMAAAGMTRATLVGGSSGGGLAVNFALAHPEAVEALLLVSPSLDGYAYSKHWESRNGYMIPRALVGDFAGLAREPHIFAPRSDAARARFAAILSANRGNLTAGNPVRTGPVGWPRLGEIQVPTLILTGEHDMPDLQAQAGALAALIPGARREIVSDAAHYPYMERPDAFVRMLADFVS